MNELTVNKNSLPVKSMQEIQAIGKMFEESGMFGCSQQGQGMVLAMTCVMEGKTPIQVMETYHLIGGRPSMRSDAMLANLLKLGGVYKIICRNSEIAEGEFIFRDANYTSKFTWEEAQKEPFVLTRDKKGFKDNWATPRARMQSLWARVVSDGVRVVCPLANQGSYTPEENMDIYENDDHETDSVPSVEQPFVTPAEFIDPNKLITVPSEKVDPKNTFKVPGLEKLEKADPKIIPVGDLKGKPWNVLTLEQLKIIKGKNLKSVTPEHIKEIEAEIALKTAELEGGKK